MLRSLKQGSVVAHKIGGKFKFPEKFKGTILEKWADYWKNLFIDYRQMLQDLRTDIQDDPRKAIKWTTILTTSYLLAKNNPNEIDFKHNLKSTENEVAMVSDACLNKEAIDYLRFLEICYNQGVIHYQNLGVFSIMYTSELNESCDLYKAQCSYLKPTLFSFPMRIVDIGLMGHWWNLYRRTANYDVNFEQ